MTRAIAGIVALDAVYVLVGALFLEAIGLLDRRRLRPATLGLALVAGWALTGIAVATVITVGVPVSVPAVLAVATGLAAASLLLRRWVGREEPEPPPPQPQPRNGKFVASAGGAVVVVALTSALVTAVKEGADRNWDAWAFWLAKAKTLVYFDGLDTRPGGFTSYANPEYPPLAPALDAATFSFMGDVAPAYLPIQHWSITAAFVAALVALLGQRVPAYALWPALALLAAAPGVRSLATSTLADLQLAMMLGLAAVLLALHVVERQGRLLAAAAAFLGAAALLKTEGFVLALVLVAVASVASLGRTRRRATPRVGALALVPVAALAPWKLWLHANGVPLNSPVFDYGLLLRPAELADRFPRLTYAAEEMLRLLFAPDRWLLLAPAVAAAALLVLVRRSRLGFVAAAWLVGAFFALASSYWLGTVDLYWHVDTSAGRVLTSVAVIGGALLPLLLADLDRRHRAASAPPAGGAG